MWNHVSKVQHRGASIFSTQFPKSASLLHLRRGVRPYALLITFSAMTPQHHVRVGVAGLVVNEAGKLVMGKRRGATLGVGM